MNTLLPILYVAIGGAVGSVVRFKLSGLVLRQFIGWTFPISTFVINIVGCFAIGVLAGLGEKHEWLSTDLRLLLITGLLGGFTTFSAFGLETFVLLRQGAVTMAFLYILSSVMVGLLLLMCGFWLTR